MNTLTLQPAHRLGEELGGGAHRAARQYQEIVVDGIPLGPKVRAVQDCISRLGWGSPQYRQEALAALLLERGSDFTDGRTALFVCPECGDLACGAVTAIIERQGAVVTWRDFSYETEIDPPLALDPLRELGPFSFSWDQYSAALRAATAAAPPDPPPPKVKWWHRRVL